MPLYKLTLIVGHWVSSIFFFKSMWYIIALILIQLDGFPWKVASLLSLKCLRMPRHLLCNSNNTQFSLTLSLNTIRSKITNIILIPLLHAANTGQAQLITSASVTYDSTAGHALCGFLLDQSHRDSCKTGDSHQQRGKRWQLPLTGLCSHWAWRL